MRLHFDTIDALIERYADDLADDTLTSWAMAGQVYLIESAPGWAFRPYVIGDRSETGRKEVPDSWFVSREVGRVETAHGALPETVRVNLGEDDSLPSPAEVREVFEELSRALTPAEVEAKLIGELESQADHYRDIVDARRLEAVAAVRAGIAKSTVARAANITRVTLDAWVRDARKNA